MKPALRKKQIIKKAIQISVKKGYRNLTRKELSNKLFISCSLINYYFKLPELKKIVIQYAIDNDVIEILAQAVINKDISIGGLKSSTKRKIIQYIGA